MSRKPASVLTAGVLFLLAPIVTTIKAAAITAPDSAAKPNVIVIMADDLGYGDLSSYGSKDLVTPNVDSLVERGMRFDFAYANCPVCSPSRASLFTGRYPEMVGVPGVIRTHADNSWGYFSLDAVTLPSVLKKANYHCALVGKWHLGLKKENWPNQRGFDHFHGFLGDMMDDYYTHQRHGNDYMYLNDQPIDPKGHATDLFSQWACEYLKSREGQPEPFLLCLTYNAPHTPIQPPADWLAKVKQRETAITEKRAKLIALIEHMDDGIGQVIKTLKQCKLDQNTIIIFTSDNGGQLNVGANNGDLRDGKQSMYEGGIRVPTCVVWPGKIKAGSHSDQAILTMDIFPTVCEAASVQIDHKIDGVSFIPILTGESVSLAERDVFFHRREGGLRYGGLTINAVQRGPWKLLQNTPYSPQELYNLKSDPTESTNLAQTHRNKLQELAKALRTQVQNGGRVPWQPPQE